MHALQPAHDVPSKSAVKERGTDSPAHGCIWEQRFCEFVSVLEYVPQPAQCWEHGRRISSQDPVGVVRSSGYQVFQRACPQLTG